MTLLLHMASLAQLLPVFVGVAGDRMATPFRRGTALWCLVLFVSDVASLMAGLSGGVNLWLVYLVLPVATGMGLWTLSLAHPDTTARLAIRVAIPLQVLVGVVLTITVEDPATFSLVAGPFHALVVMLAAVWTFLRLAMVESNRLGRQDWFWIILGIMIYGGTLTALQPVSWFLRSADRMDLLAAAYYARAAAEIVAFLAITGGMLCPVPKSSGGFSSPPFSPSGSSSGPSASRW